MNLFLMTFKSGTNRKACTNFKDGINFKGGSNIKDNWLPRFIKTVKGDMMRQLIWSPISAMNMSPMTLKAGTNLKGGTNFKAGTNCKASTGFKISTNLKFYMDCKAATNR